MKRDLYAQLLIWKNKTDRKPLLLQGARQVGKTYLINQFGQNEYSQLITLNFERSPELQSLFTKSLSAKKIIENIELYIGKKIDPTNTLLFFDEIQISEQAISSLKYFYEEAPAYHLVAAGSLLGVSVAKSTSFPVGKVNFMTLYPMSFLEYLQAMDENILAEMLSSIKKIEPIQEIIHEKLTDHFKKYLYHGGMPEVVLKCRDNLDTFAAREIQNDILESYVRDFSKYAEKSQSVKISEVWNSVPYQLAKENKKFKYSDVRAKGRSSAYESTIEWLRKAGLVYLAKNISLPEIPLAGYADVNKFKLYLFDTGLLSAMLKLSPKILLEDSELFSKYNGAFIENFVACELTTSGEKELFYWSSKSDAEVDFVFQFDDKIYPLEVKSGTNKNMKSLQSYAEKYNPDLIMRVSPRNFIRSGRFINLPLYAVSAIKKLLAVTTEV